MLLILGLFWVWLVFPTPYKYWNTQERDGGFDAYRRNRFTGNVDAWYGASGGWRSWTTDSWIENRHLKKKKEETLDTKESK